MCESAITRCPVSSSIGWFRTVWSTVNIASPMVPNAEEVAAGPVHCGLARQR